MWHEDKSVERTYADHSTQWVWAKIEGLGWIRIKDGATDGCTNLFIIMNAAKANNRKVNVKVESKRITAAYLN